MKIHSKIGRFYAVVLVYAGISCLVLANNGDKKIRFVTTVYPLTEFCQAVCGDKGVVVQLIPSGAEAHSWHPSPGDIRMLWETDIVVYISSLMEPDIHKVVSGLDMKKTRIIQADPIQESDNHHQNHKVGHGGEEKEHFHSYDPHVWLDFKRDGELIDRIVDVLREMSPGDGEYFRNNAADYKEQLRTLDQQFREELVQCPLKKFYVGGHAAFGYFARNYDLEQVALYGISPDALPTPRRYAEIIELAKNDDIDVVFFEYAVGEKLAKSLAEEIGAEALVLNPGATRTREQEKMGITFLDIMRKNLENLKYGLGCR